MLILLGAIAAAKRVALQSQQNFKVSQEAQRIRNAIKLGEGK